MCLSCAKKGSNNPMSGRRHSKETKTKMSGSALGEKNHEWKGDKVGYLALHDWVRNNFGTPKKCEHCGKEGLTGQRINWANISGRYLRVKSDWVRLCVKCHRKFDKISK